MTKQEAIEKLSDELHHAEGHLKDTDKAEIFYKEMQDYVDALNIGIEAIKKEVLHEAT